MTLTKILCKKGVQKEKGNKKTIELVRTSFGMVNASVTMLSLNLVMWINIRNGFKCEKKNFIVSLKRK